MPHHPSIAITAISGSIPGSLTVWATHEDTGKDHVFLATVQRGEGALEEPWRATAEASGRSGHGASHIGPWEAAVRAMEDALPT